MAIATAAAPATINAALVAFEQAVTNLWRAGCPSAREDHSPEGQWFNFSVRRPETPWYTLATTATYAECVEAMANVARQGVLPEGTLIRAARCHGYCEYDCSHHEQTFLLTTVGRMVHLEPYKD